MKTGNTSTFLQLQGLSTRGHFCCKPPQQEHHLFPNGDINYLRESSTFRCTDKFVLILSEQKDKRHMLFGLIEVNEREVSNFRPKESMRELINFRPKEYVQRQHGSESFQNLFFY